MNQLGIYIHIPFCKQACHYCNFHFSTSMKSYDRMIHAILLEMENQKDEFVDKEIQTIYFGGGTPSLLEKKDLTSILEKINALGTVAPDVETTLEANPDDLDEIKIEEFSNAGVNRISLGVQSFYDEHLTWMNRSHNTVQANRIMSLLKENKHMSVNADLIFALPMLTNDQWKNNLEKLLNCDIDHWSCYNLTVEPKTVLHHRVLTQIEPDIDPDKGAEQFELLMDFADKNGMDHYEISNYCKPGKYAIHNTNYWKEVPYLGFGPSAHSFDGLRRSWNIAHNMKYINYVEQGTNIDVPTNIRTFEDRPDETIYNEYVMTSLRTKWGCSLERIKQINEKFVAFFKSEMSPFILNKWVENKGDQYYLTRAGKLRADLIASDLFLV